MAFEVVAILWNTITTTESWSIPCQQYLQSIPEEDSRRSSSGFGRSGLLVLSHTSKMPGTVRPPFEVHPACNFDARSRCFHKSKIQMSQFRPWIEGPVLFDRLCLYLIPRLWTL